MSVLDQLARLFLEPQPTSAADPDVRWLPPGESPLRGPAARRVAVICSPREARVAGGAVALALASAAPVILEWTGTEQAVGQDRPASPAARRVAGLLRERGTPAVAAGRLVRAALPGAEDEAAEHALATLRFVDGASVIVVAGPRGPAIEAVLARQDQILLAVGPRADAEMTELALAALSKLAPCSILELPPSPGAAGLARSGVALVAPLRSAVRGALG